MYKAIKYEDIPDAKTGGKKYIDDLYAFLESDDDAWEIEIPANTTTLSVYNSLAQAIHRKKAPVFAIKRGDRVFLLKKSAASGVQDRKAAKK